MFITDKDIGKYNYTGMKLQNFPYTGQCCIHLYFYLFKVSDNFKKQSLLCVLSAYVKNCEKSCKCFVQNSNNFSITQIENHFVFVVTEWHFLDTFTC